VNSAIGRLLKDTRIKVSCDTEFNPADYSFIFVDEGDGYLDLNAIDWLIGNKLGGAYNLVQGTRVFYVTATMT
jgi:hypothetical protein